MKLFKIGAVRDVRVEVEIIVKAEDEEEAKKRVLDDDYEDIEFIEETPNNEWDILSVSELTDSEVLFKKKSP